MTRNGEIHRFNSESKNWLRAFELYHKATGDYDALFGCSNCIKKVKEWLTA